MSVTAIGTWAHRGWVSDCYWNFWRTESGSVTTIGTSSAQRLGQWLLLVLLMHRARVSGCHWSCGEQRLGQWHFLVFLHTEDWSFVRTVSLGAGRCEKTVRENFSLQRSRQNKLYLYLVLLIFTLAADPNIDTINRIYFWSTQLAG